MAVRALVDGSLGSPISNCDATAPVSASHTTTLLAVSAETTWLNPRLYNADTTEASWLVTRRVRNTGFRSHDRRREEAANKRWFSLSYIRWFNADAVV